MTGTIELRGFMWLATIFKERGWSNPHRFSLVDPASGNELLVKLGIPLEQVGAIFVNFKAYAPAEAVIKPGDRVALVSRGTPVFPWVVRTDSAPKHELQPA